MNLLNFKKAQGHNYLAVVIFIFTFGVISMLGTLILSNFITVFEQTGFWDGVIEETANKFLAAMSMYDYIIILVLVVLIIGIGVTSYRLSTSPAFFIITLVMASVYGFVSYFFNFIFIELISNEAFDVVLVLFPRTILICTNLHWVALVSIVIGSITLYAKKEKGQYVE